MTFTAWLRALSKGAERISRKAPRKDAGSGRTYRCRPVLESLEERALMAVVDFLPAKTFTSGGTAPRTVALGDFNNDGIDDLVAANSNSLTVFLGDASGDLAAAGTYGSGGGTPVSLAVGDFNNDGNSDIAAANVNSNRIGILLGDGTGGFGATSIVPSGGSIPLGIAAADFNGDGLTDLAVANTALGGLAILQGSGDGSFAAAEAVFSGANGPRSLAVSDFNGDGRPDLAVGHSASDNVAVLLGNGSGSLSSPTLFSTGTPNTTSLAVGDFNNDGRMDLAAANASPGNGVGVLAGDGAGGLALVNTYSTGGTGTRSVTVGDFNSDGHSDIAVANSLSGNLGVLLGDGASGFQPAAVFSSGGVSPLAIAAGDFNGDGQLDLAVANTGSQTIGLLLNSTVIAFEDVPKNIDGLAVSHEDVAAVLTVTLAVQNGTLNVDPTAAATEISGNGTGTILLVGTQAEINATLAAGVVYLGDADFSGGETLTMTTTDAEGGSYIDLVQIQVLSAEQQALALMAILSELNDEGVLNNGQELSLVKILSLLTASSTGPLLAFTQRVTALVNSGTLTQQEADELIASASSIVASLQ